MSKAYAIANANKKKKETVQQKQSPSVSKKTKQVNDRLTQKYGGGTTNTKSASKPVSKAKSQAVQSRLQRKYGGTTKTETETPKRMTLQERQNQKSYGDRSAQPVKRQTTSSAQRRTNANNNLNLKQNRIKQSQAEAKERREFKPTASQQMDIKDRLNNKYGVNKADEKRVESANRVIRNTGSAAKKGVQDALSGYGKTIADVTEMTAEKGTNAYAMKLGIDNKQAAADRKRTAEDARKERLRLAEEQDKRQKKFDNQTKGAKGLEKALYGAVESGTGMAVDMVAGLGTQAGALASMGVRTYGQTRGQAEKEGATEREDRLYALTQAGKEVGTELMFPGVGLARKAYGGAARASLGELATNTLLRNLKGKTADVASAGIKLLGGTAEENLEEIAGWGIDPILKEYTYGRNVRKRDAENVMRERSDALRSQITNEDDAKAAAAYISSPSFIEDTKREYINSGMNEKDAEEIASRMRDYLSASLTGDTKAMADIEDEVGRKVAGLKKLSIADWDFKELAETVASTTLLTATTGMPGTVATATKGAAIRDALGSEGTKALAKTAIDFEDEKLSRQGRAIQERLDSGKDITSTQAYELMSGMHEQVRKDTQRVEASRSTAARQMESERLVVPFAEDPRTGEIIRGEVTEQTFRKEATSAKKAIEDQKASLTAKEVDTGSRAIANFKTGIFGVDDANALNYSNEAVREAFKAETGINLDSYIVRNRDGSVDIPATNTATKDALFALAADNLIKTAQAETVNWMDNVKGEVVTQITARMGAKGSVAFQQALDDVDERDRSRYMMTANATDMLYQAARNMGESWEEVKADAVKMFPNISEDKLQMMYEAGLEDRNIANDKARGRQVQMGESMSQIGEQETATGMVYVDTPNTPKGTMVRTFTEIAQNLGADIHLTDAIRDKDGTAIDRANGSYDPKTNSFYLNVDTGIEKNVGYIFMHELTHYLRRYAPEQYQELENLVREKWFGYDASQMQDAIAKKIEAYKIATNGKQILTEDMALEEIICDAAHEFINDPNFANSVAEEDPTLAQAVLNSIRNALRMLRQIFAKGTIEDETHMNSLFSELGILSEAEEIWLNAYKQAVKNRAMENLDAWEDEAFKDTRLSIRTTNDVLSERDARFSITPEAVEALNDPTKANTYAEDQMLDDSDNTVQDLSSSDLSIRFSFGPGGTFYEKGFHAKSGANVTGSDIKKSKGNPLLQSGKDILTKTMKKNIRAELKRQGIKGKAANEIINQKVENVMNFMDAMNSFMENTGLQYTFIGMQDVYNAKISVRKTSEGVQAITMSAMVKNGEYPINFDFTTICKKRQAFNAIIEKLTAESAEGVDISLSPQELGEINNALRKEGLETACLGCFVEARRYNMQNYTNKVCDLWNKCVDEYAASIGIDPADVGDFNFSNGEETTEQKFQDAADTFFEYENTQASKKNPEDRFKHIIRSSKQTYMKHLHPADLITSSGIQHIKDMSTKSKDFFGMLKSAYGVSAPKETIKYVPYNSEVALLPENRGTDKDGNKRTMLDYLKSIGGIRMQSFSDYLVANTFDYMQMVADMAARGFPAHAYTKEIAFARVFGMTGIKINLSIMFDVQNLNYWRGIFKNASEDRLKEIASKYAGLQYFENADDIPEEFKDYDKDGKLILDHGSVMEINEDGVKGYLTYLVGDENRSQRYWEETYRRVLDETKDEAQAEEQANEYRKWIQSINFKDAKDLQRKNGYGANCGMIGVGLSDANILLMLNDDNIPYIIPYHASGLPDVIKQHTGLNFATNYEDTQNTRIFVNFTKDGEELDYDYVRDLKDELGSWQKAWEKVSEEIRNGDIVANGRTPKAATDTEPAEVNKDGNPYVLHGTADFDFYEKLDDGASPQEAAEMYLEYCDEYGLLPVFPQFAGHPNYYKLLVDYSVTDLSNNKATSPQGTVRNIYPGSNGTIANIDEGSTDYEGIKDILVDEFEKLNKKNNHRDEVVDKIVDEWKRKDIRHSITPEMDSAYIDAVNSGNMEEAQRLVDEAAKMAGYNQDLYHGTGEYFNVFRLGREGIHLGNIEQAEQVARNRYHDRSRETRYKWGEIKDRIHEMDTETRQSLINRLERTSAHAPIFDGDISDAESVKAYAEDALQKYYGTQTDINNKSVLIRTFDRNVGENVMRMYARLDNPFVINGDILDWTPWNIADTLLLKADGNTEYRDDFTERRIDISGSDLNLGKWTRKAVEQIANGEVKGDEAWRLLDGVLEQAGGYHGIKYLNQFEGDKNSYSYIALNRRDVKLADPVTYAEDGSIIPLSERFDPNNDDIRYSMPTQDADGNILSDGQMEYFKNSQARDENGRLLNLYHGTSSAGFNIFRSDRIIWLTTSRRDADSYGGNWEHKIYDPEEMEQRVAAFGGSYRPDNPFFENFRFDTEEDLQDFIATHPDIDKIKSDEDLYDLLEEGEIDDDEYDRMNRLSKEYEKDYRRYELNRFGDFTWGDLMDNPEKFTKDDFYRAILAWDKEASVDDMDEVTIEDFLSVMQEEEELQQSEGSTMRDMPFRTRIPEGEEGEYVYPVNQRTYEVYANLTNPLIVDIRGRGIEGNYGYVDDMIAGDYDGLILRNCRVGRYHDIGDVVIARQPNQVKDTRNENPTENPDIRYSVTPEDEAKSRMAYADAMDDSYEALERYEKMAAENPNVEQYFGKAFKEEDVSEFYSALRNENGIVFEDPVLEEGRQRVAKTKNELYSNIYAKANDRWTTGGEILDIDSVKTNVRNLVMGTMANSNTDHKYKQELVDKTLIDMRTAFQLMKQDRTDIASALLYHSAQRMIENVDFIKDDTLFKEYKGIRDYLRREPIYMDEEYWQSKTFLEFQRANMGKLKLRKGDGNVDVIYGQLEELWPHIFNETERHRKGLEDSPEDLLEHIEYVINQNQKPFMEAYSSEEATSLCYEIADNLYDIMARGEELSTLADTYKKRFDQRTKALKARHQEAIAKVRENAEKKLDREKSKNEDLKRQLKTQKLKTDAETRYLKYRNKVDIGMLKAENAKERRAERERRKKEKAQRKENALHKKYMESIQKSHKALTDRLRTNTKDKHIPEFYKKQLAALLGAFDFQTVKSKAMEMKEGPDGYVRVDPSAKTIKMLELQAILKAIENQSQLFHVSDSITDIMDNLLGIAPGSYGTRQSIDGKTLDELDSSELKDIDRMLKSLIHEFNNYENVRVGMQKQKASTIGGAQIESCLKHAEKFGTGNDYLNAIGAVDQIINLDEMTPAYLFRRIDPNGDGLGIMWKELRRSFDRYVRNQNQLNDWMEEIVGKYHKKGKLWNKYGSDELSKWRSENYAIEFTLSNGQTIKLTIAQMMSIHCLAKRDQAYRHMTGAGIVVKPVSFQAKMMSDLKKKANYALPVSLSHEDLLMIDQNLSKEQIDVADKLQQLMATKMAEWGNEASMNVIGIRLFEDPDYFPIKSDRAALEKDFSAEQFTEMIRSFGFTKAVQPGAKNAIAIDDIFDVVTEHCNNMNLYNSYTESLNDFMKVYNYHQLGPNNSDYSVEQAVAHAYSQKATTFISTFIKDLNGNVSKGRQSGISKLMDQSLGNAKKASVFANGRVALQQPTAIVRAFAEISPKYLVGVNPTKENMKEMFEHCPIALWKSWGYYDINMGKSIEDLMMNNGSWLEDMASDLYGKLDNATWSVIWGMCKNEIKDTHKEVEEGTDEFFDLVNERMSEVVDLTQVVDSPFHRSHAMRSKDFLHKMTTAFMAEPTLTFNMVRDGFVRAREAWKEGNKAEARKIFNKTARVFLLQATTVAAAAAIWDAIRGKKPNGGDDDDKNKLQLWYANFIANLKDNINLLNNIYYIKDIVSIMEGWDQKNLGLQGFKHIADAKNQLFGTKRVFSSNTWYENALYGIGYLTGIPFKTLMNDSKSIMNMIGVHPGFLDYADEHLMSLQDMLGGESSSAGINKPTAKSKKSSIKESSGDVKPRLWDYENAPIKFKDGSLADSFLNAMGINLTEAERSEIAAKAEAEERDKKVEDIISKTESLSGESKDKKVWSYVTTYLKSENGDKPLSDFIQEGDYDTVEQYKEMYLKAGGNEEYFDSRIYDTSKRLMKKSIINDPTDEQIEAQNQIKDYLLSNGMSEEELSEMAYKSDVAKDLKVAFRINDKEAMLTELEPLVRAGLSYEDLERLWENRNRMDLKSYKGKYKDRLKSTGNFVWPTQGTITSHFGYRNSPTAGASSNHPAIDIGAATGTPVVAADGGVVITAGSNGGYGNSVGIKHDNGMVTYYNHLYSWNVKVGDTVAQGQQIAQVGSTGISTGPHLDFKILDTNGKPVDPEKYLPTN